MMTEEKHPLQYLLEEAEQKKLQGKHEEAIKVCEKILSQDIECAEALEEIGDNYLSLRQYDKSKKALHYAIKLNAKSPNANYLLGFTYSALGNFKASIDYLEKADEIQPNHPEILRCLGWSIFHDSQKEKGIFILERALNLRKDDPLILSDLGICHLGEKNYDRSAYLFKRVLEIEPNNDKARECLNAVRFFQKEFRNFKQEN